MVTVGVDTRTEGTPSSVYAVASWVRTGLGSGVEASVDGVSRARRAVGDGWEGQAGESFDAQLRSEAAREQSFSASLDPFARAVEDYGSALSTHALTMAGVRERAAAAGLTISGTVVVDPGVGPGKPWASGDLTPSQEAQYDRMVADYEHHQALVTAYAAADNDAAAAERRLIDAQDLLARAGQDIKNKLALYIVDWSGALRGAVAAGRGKTLLAQAKTLRNQLDELVAGMDAAEQAAWRQRYSHLFDQLMEDAVGEVGEARGALSTAEFQAGRMEQLAKWSERLGPVVAAVGIGYDISQGKDPTEAVVSGTVGFAAGWGASIAAGAAIGTLVPIPVVGTVGGALIGAAVGVFTSGAIDSLFEGGGVGDAIADGAHAVEEAGDAIAGGLSGAWNALFD